ncbi:MAG: hypothetical protein A2293_06140 [Elusimicrobia bacterium RIFOXYB2_FULL_49_7]|nr:MAG: hypothetical protein A2293_06140 [Elusimicrobia bacterium RIFOXYB2_FULL_49_7]
MSFLLGSQYYRYPTPEPHQWEEDILHAKKLGLDFLQLRPQWRVHERQEGCYEWDDTDKLFELCGRHGLKVIFKFLLETGPEWLFDRYQTFRIAPDGTKITPYADASFYVGGMIPCFDHPVVREKAIAFVREAVKRYRSADALLYWHAWNEPRNRPFSECACPHSVSLYRDWLKARFFTIENYNRAVGMAEGSFEELKPPIHYHHYTTVALWKEWARTRVAERLNFVVGAIRQEDPGHRILAHVGMCSPLQDILNDGSDDRLNAPEVDVYGCSYVHWTGDCRSFARLEGSASFAFPNWKKHYYIYSLQTDWIRSCKNEVWVNEFYSNDWSKESPDFTDEDIRFRLYEALANGINGINLWQFRPERYCSESGNCGIIEPNGSDNERSVEIRRFNEFRRAQGALLDSYQKSRGDAALIYDVDSDLISRLEETDEDNRNNTVLYRYKNSLKGWYSLFWRNRMNADILSSRDFDRLSDYPAVVLPYMTRLTEAHAETLKAYVKNGGVLFAEPCLGMRDNRNWLHETIPPFGLNELFGRSHTFPKAGKLPFKTQIKKSGKGKAVYFNDFPGERYYNGSSFPEAAFMSWFKKTMGFKEYFKAKGLVVVKRGESIGKEVIFILNYENKKVTATLCNRQKRVSLQSREVKVLWH